MGDGYRGFMRVLARGIEILRPRLPNYDRARSELGGMPWRRFDHTEKWFIATPTTNLDELLAPSGDAVDLQAGVSLKPQLPLRMIAGAGATVLGFILLAVLLTRAPSHHEVASVAAQPAPVASVAPVALVSEPATKHARTKKVRVAKHHLAKVHHRASASLRGPYAA
jgi:hypothetical protein